MTYVLIAVKEKAYDCTRKCILIERCYLLERFFIRGYLEKTLVDGLRDIFNYVRWLVGFGVYIERDVSWLRKGSLCTFL